jgi:hypothetical protein
MFQKSIPVESWNKLPFWEFEEYIKMLNERNKEENKRQKEEKEEMNDKMPNFNSMSNFKPPSYNTPNMGSYLK